MGKIAMDRKNNLKKTDLRQRSEKLVIKVQGASCEIARTTRPSARILLTSLFRNMKYIWMKMKAILVAGVRASIML